MQFLLDHFQNKDIKHIWSSNYYINFNVSHLGTSTKIRTSRFFDSINKLCDKLQYNEVTLKNSISLYFYLYPTGDVAPINKKEFAVVSVKEQIK